MVTACSVVVELSAPGPRSGSIKVDLNTALSLTVYLNTTRALPEMKEKKKEGGG